MVKTETDRNASRYLLLAAFLGTLFLWMAHASIYKFLTDDAFISFRYARNLAEGHGLVYNPACERVEGYTNLLWVLLLAGLSRLGVKPENAAHVLSLMATVGLWAVVSRHAWRNRAAGAGAWLILIPPLFLAATRSVAVWSTSGLETRLFELLVVAGVFRLEREVQARLEDSSSGAPWAALLLALATLTRPDGLLISACAFGVAGAVLAVARRLAWREVLMSVLAYATLVGGHYAFRRIYYGEWLPNTYYTKVVGETWWSMGWIYLATFLLEYGAWLWLPVIAAAIANHHKRGTAWVPALWGAVILPHAVYIVSIGGDHFEFRPLDLYFPFVFLLLCDGVRALWKRPVARIFAGGWIVLMLVALVDIPWQSHRQFPAHTAPGFPGVRPLSKLHSEYLAPEQDLLYRLPGLRWLAEAHRNRLRILTAHYAGLRQEDHRKFSEGTVGPQGRSLAKLVREGTIPPDTHIAIGPAGAVPYLSGLRTLDRYGLNDAVVARSQPSGFQAVAHGKSATLDYAARVGVDLWSLDDDRLLWAYDDYEFLSLIKKAREHAGEVYVADVGDHRYILALLPKGPEQTLPRFPRLHFTSVLNPEPIDTLFRQAIESHRRRVERAMGDADASAELARVLEVTGDREGAFSIYRDLAASGAVDACVRLANACARAGQFKEALAPLQEAVRRSPHYAVPIYDLGITCGRLGDARRERQLLELAVRTDPINPDARYALGLAYLSLGQRDLALRQYRSLSGIDWNQAPKLLQAIDASGGHSTP